MTTLLSNIKTFLSQKNVASQNDIFFNYIDSANLQNLIILKYIGGKSSDIAKNSAVSVIIKNTSMAAAETTAFSAFNSLCPQKQYQKPLSVNGQLMLITPQNPPSYIEKENNGLHVFSFNINVIHSN